MENEVVSQVESANAEHGEIAAVATASIIIAQLGDLKKDLVAKETLGTPAAELIDSAIAGTLDIVQATGLVIPNQTMVEAADEEFKNADIVELPKLSELYFNEVNS
ncbi:hypothetical protein D3C78_1302320 [compost metagenome]